MFHISQWGGLELCFGELSPPNPPWRLNWLQTDVYFEKCITKPCQVVHRPFGCSAVITTCYIRLQLRWITLFSTAIAKLCNCFA